MMPLSMWTIYDHPKDHPFHYVARRFVLDRPTADVIVDASLAALRRLFAERGLVCLDRAPDDDPVIVETWV